MRSLTFVLLLATASACRAQDLAKLPTNTWVELKYSTVQPADPEEKGFWSAVGWNKIVYDEGGKRVLFYDRWHDKKHGGYTIYGNCLFAFDPATLKLSPLKIDHWKKIEVKSGYRTVVLPENEKEPTPASRHVYHAFELAPDLKAVFLCNGANQSVMKDDKLVAHDECDGAWRLDLASNRWSRVGSNKAPANRLDESMAYSPETKSMIYSAGDGQLWILDLGKNEWRKAKESPPQRTAMGRTVVYDPTRKRMLLVGGGRLDAWQKGEAPEFHEVYGFDPKTESIQRLAGAPTALYESQLAFDSKREMFVTVAVFNKKEHPSGMFAYDPKKDAWHEITPKNAIPPHTSWMGWMKLCYAADQDCFIGIVRDKIFAYRLEPAPAP